MADGERSRYFLDDPDYHRVADFFEIEFDNRKDPTLAGKLSYLYDWGKVAGGNDRLESLVAIRQLREGLGLQMQGKELVDRLFKWTRLDADRKRIEGKMGVLSINQKGDNADEQTAEPDS